MVESNTLYLWYIERPHFFPFFSPFLQVRDLLAEGAKLQIFNGWLSTTINRPATRSLTVLLRKRAVATRR